MKANGWSDIGYSFLATFGRLWEAATAASAKAVVGARAGSVDSFAVSAISNYDTPRRRQ